MDWTGGTRRRFAAGKNNATVQKQKQYFAKARAAIQTTPGSQRSFQPDSLGLPQEGRGLDVRDARDARPRVPAVTTYAYPKPRKRPHDSEPEHERGARPQLKRRRTHDAPSIFSISSGKRSSYAGSLRNGPVRSPHTRASAGPAIGVSAEEQALSNVRRSLLARKDWLGLSATRPLHMSFKSSHDKDKVGKRRKTGTSSQRANPAVLRLLTPLFEERLHRPQHILSGALSPQDIRIKVGTEALASQTQPSRRSHTPANTSMRPPSTEFGPISEESMLLGDDGDSFEAYEPGARPVTASHATGLEGQPVELRGEKLFRGAQRIPESPDMGAVDILAQYRHDLRPTSDEPPFRVRQGKYDVPVHVSDENQGGTFSQHDATHLATSHVAAPVKDISEQQENEDEDDAIWRRIMAIKQRTSSDASIAALKSSSQHITTSDSSHRPVLQVEREAADQEQPVLSTPRGAGTQGNLFHGHCSTSAETPAELQSPSASLKQIMRLAEQPPRPTEQEADDDTDNDALWRQFVIGSGDSGSESSQLHVMPASQEELEHAGDLTARPPSAITTGLGTSANTTIGGTARYSRSTGRPSLGELSSRNPMQPQGHRQQSLAAVEYQGHTHTDNDSIEGISPCPANRRQSINIHAGLGRMPSAGRSRTSTSQAQPPPRKPEAIDSGQRPTRVSKRNRGLSSKARDPAAGHHDIYDLVDSDGASLM